MQSSKTTTAGARQSAFSNSIVARSTTSARERRASGGRSKRLNVTAISFLWCLLNLTLSSAASLTLSWDAPTSTNTLGFRIYQASATGSFSPITNVADTVRMVQVDGLDTNVVNRFYLTRLQKMPPYSLPESEPSNVVTNVPPVTPPTTQISFSAPTLSTSNLVQGATLSIVVKITNSGTTPFGIQSGSIVLLAPGATQVSGPYIYAASIAAQIVNASTTAAFSASWPTTTATPIGAWSAYIVIQDGGGTWTAGPQTPFNVVAPTTPLPNVSPTNLRLNAINNSRIDLEWTSTQSLTTRVEKSENFSPFSVIATVPSGVLGYSYTSIRKNRDYRFRVAWVGSPNYSNQIFYSTR